MDTKKKVIAAVVVAMVGIIGATAAAEAAPSKSSVSRYNSYYDASVIVYTPTAKVELSVTPPKQLSTALLENRLALTDYRTPTGEVVEDRILGAWDTVTLVSPSFKGYKQAVAVRPPVKVTKKLSWMPVGAYKITKAGNVGAGVQTTNIHPDPANPANVIETKSIKVTKKPTIQQRHAGSGSPVKIKALKCKNRPNISKKAKSWTRVAYANTCRLFPAVKHYGSYRAGKNQQDHGTGHALDVMTYKNKKLGSAIASHYVRNHKAYNVKYVIWNQKIWAPYRADEGWRKMEDRGSATANHKDHVHISLY